MNIRVFGLAVLTVTAFTPSICSASERAALNACARAFAASMVPEGVAAPPYKLDYRGSWGSGSIADYFPTNSTFELEAHDPKTGAVIARASCSTNTRGVIVALSPLPLSDRSVTLADRL